MALVVIELDSSLNPTGSEHLYCSLTCQERAEQLGDVKPPFVLTDADNNADPDATCETCGQTLVQP